MIENILVLHLILEKSHNQDTAKYKLEEACNLVIALGNVNIVGKEILNVSTPKAGTLMGLGSVETIKNMLETIEASVVFINSYLSPIQARNLEKAWNTKVVDRTGLILAIFASRARTKEGKLQVELASLEYQKGRLVKMWSHLERQRSGGGFTGGPGETQKELDKRLIEERIVKLKNKISEVVRTREIHRKSREKVPYPTVAMVGYTNAGKSTLFNKITNAGVFATNLLFATLDPTMRQLILPSKKKIILSDTVGFISDLPHQLVASFKATLDEVILANVLLHVQDISSAQHEAQHNDVISVLEELGISGIDYQERTIEVYNKVDLLTSEQIDFIKNRNPKAILVSALTGEGIEELIRAVEEKILSTESGFLLEIPFEDGEALAWVLSHTSVQSRLVNDTCTVLQVRCVEAHLQKLNKTYASYIKEIL